jgi:hypothetical protein
MQANVLKRSAVAVAIAGAFALGGVAADRLLPSAALAAVVPTANPAAPTVAVNGAPTVALPDFSGLVEQYGPAVVNISVTSGNRKGARSGRKRQYAGHAGPSAGISPVLP